jgi:hypothetical protein
MGSPLGRFVSILIAAMFLSSGHFAAAGNPIGDFFKRLGDSIAHPHSSPSPPPRRDRRATGKKQSDNQKVVPPDTPPPALPRWRHTAAAPV